MSFLSRLGVGGRFRLAFGALVAAVVLVGGIGLSQAFRMDDVASDLANNRIPSLTLVGRLAEGVARYRQLQGSLLLASAKDRAEIEQRMKQTESDIEATRHSYEPLIDPGEETTVLFPAIVSSWAEYKRVSAALAAPGLDPQAAANIYLNEIYPAFMKLREAIQRDLAHNRAAGEAGARNANDAFTSAIWMTGGVTIVAIVIALAMAKWLNASVTARVIRLSQAMRRLAQRDYGFELPSGAMHDEIGDMTRAVDECRTGLKAADAIAATTAAE
ncbi:MAG: MCP four helix bundle domain-containing protein, partial [Rhodospirillales bacterium]|nr:MCP four helix bundle domain-containing protein [Rhodospirillales bacterium]